VPRPGKDIAPVEDAGDRLEDDIRRADDDGAPGATVRPPRERQDAIVRADQLAARSSFDGDCQPIGPTPGSMTARPTASAGANRRLSVRMRPPARMSCGATPWEMSMTVEPGEMRAMTA
jgi:hypothetical protein